LRVLVVDDSAYQRLTLSAALREIAGVREVETVPSGEEAIRRVVSSSFDLVTLDLEMPGIDGFAVLRWLMAHKPVPVLVISDRRHEREALVALELGAFELLGKPSVRSGGLDAWKKSLAESVLEAAQIRLDLLKQRATKAASPAGGREPASSRLSKRVAAKTPFRLAADTREIEAVVVTASTGGPPALRDLFSSFSPRAVFVGVAQHIPAPFTRSLSARLSSATGWDAREAVDGGEAIPGTIWIAPGGKHLRFDRIEDRIVTRLDSGGDHLRWCPSGDVLFRSAARTFGKRVVGVVLTGMGDDGAEGARAIEHSGGRLICESAATALISGMPDAASRVVPGALRLPLSRIGSELARLCPPVE
jgi:two-component system, chemotaxis family, protein-glutamate methylesterase/glutaminase